MDILGDLEIVTDGENFERRFGEATSLFGLALGELEVFNFKNVDFCFSYSLRVLLEKGLFCKMKTRRKT
jgi:hypothetical protein